MTQSPQDLPPAAPVRIGVFIEGTFWFHLYHYWLHHHQMRIRLALDGVQDAARWYARGVFDRPVDEIVIDQVHYFQAVREVPHRFYAVLDRLNITRHALPFDRRRKRAVGVEVEFALTCWEETYAAGLDMVMLVTGDDDNRPLVERLVSDGVKVLIPQIDVTFIDSRSTKSRWFVTSAHLRESATDTPTWGDLVEATQADEYPLISPLLADDDSGEPAHIFR